MRAVLVPRDPGTFSAKGMIMADRRRDFVRTLLLDSDECAARLDELVAPLRSPGAQQEIVTVDARYFGQSHELNVAADERLGERFHAAHEQAYGYCDRERRIEVVNLRVAAIDPAPRDEVHPPWEKIEGVRGPERMARADLSGAVLGPCVLTEMTATTVVPKGWQAQVLVDGSLFLERVS